MKSLKTKDYDALKHKLIERATSALIKATVKKSKISNSQQREAEFHITFGEGIDNARDLIAVGTAHGIVVKGGAWYAMEMSNGTTLKGQGAVAFKEELLTVEGAYEELAEKVLKAIRSGGKNSVASVHDEDDEVAEALGFTS